MYFALLNLLSWRIRRDDDDDDDEEDENVHICGCGWNGNDRLASAWTCPVNGHREPMVICQHGRSSFKCREIHSLRRSHPLLSYLDLFMFERRIPKSFASQRIALHICITLCLLAQLIEVMTQYSRSFWFSLLTHVCMPFEQARR